MGSGPDMEERKEVIVDTSEREEQSSGPEISSRRQDKRDVIEDVNRDIKLEEEEKNDSDIIELRIVDEDDEECESGNW